MKNRILFLVIANFALNATMAKPFFYSAPQSKNIYPTTVRVGTIKFPDAFDVAPSLAMYYKGVRLEGEKSKLSKTVTYSISAEPRETEFYLLVTPTAPTPVAIEENTINYFKIPKKTKYICYKLHMDVDQIRDEARRKKDGNLCYSWRTERIALDYDRIPLNTITIIYNPAFIDKIEGGDAVMLPKITFKGSPKEHTEYAINSLLAAPDINPFHSSESHDRVVQANLARKTIVVLTT